MSEYWKSVPRKFCDFCKCWITDNKPSVEFHERGKRHQENVELRLKEVRKRSVKQASEDENMKKQMDEMEKAALEAFKKDLKDNPALAAQYGVSLDPKPNKEGEKDASSTTEPKDKSEIKKKKKLKRKEWHEAKSPEGYSYYWSTKTGESRWEAPEDFLSIADQEEIKELEEKEQKEAEAKKASPDIDSKKGETITETSDTSATVTEQPVNTRVDYGHSRSAYGSWSVVREEVQPTLYDESSAPPDLEEIPLPAVPVTQETSEPKEKKQKLFKEKTVTSLGPSNVPVAFKKRKIAGGARNLRQKGGDD